MNFFHKLLIYIRDFKYINHLLALAIGVSIALTGAKFYVDSQKQHYSDLRQNNRPDRAVLYVMKGSNVKKVFDILNSLSEVQVRGLWLTSADYNKNNNTLKIDVRAVDQLDISKYNAVLAAALGDKNLCLNTIDVKKRGAKVEKKSEQKIPFVLKMLQRRKAEREAQANAAKPIENDSEESLRWVFNYEASFQYSNCIQ